MDADVPARTTAVGFWHFAEAYMLTAKHALFAQEAMDAMEAVGQKSPRPKTMAPMLFLCEHAIEFGLKAYLRSQGLTIAQIESHDRDLERLRKSCGQHGLATVYAFDTKGDAVIDLYGSLGKEQRHGYYHRSPQRQPDLKAVVEVTEALLAAIKPTCFQSLNVQTEESERD